MKRVVRLFGSFHVEERERTVDRLATRKAESLLNYLAVNLGHRIPRAKLADLLWPEADAETGRKSLRQALYFIRTHFDGVESNRVEVWLDEGKWTTDLRIIEATDLSDPRALQSALDSTHERFAPWDVEEWTDEVRVRLETLRERLQKRAMLEAEPRPLEDNAAKTPEPRYPSLAKALIVSVGILLACFFTFWPAVLSRPLESAALVDAGDWDRALSAMKGANPEFIAEFSEAAFEASYGADEAAWEPVVEKHWRHLATAVTTSVHADPELAMRISGAIWRYGHLTGRPNEAEEWIEQALKRAEPSETKERARAAAALCLAKAMRSAAGGEAHGRESLRIYEKLKDRWGQAHASRSIGMAMISSRSADKSNAGVPWYDRAHRTFTELRDESGLAVTEICQAGRPLDLSESSLDLAGQSAVCSERVSFALSAYSRYSALNNDWGMGFSLGRAWMWVKASGVDMIDSERSWQLAHAIEKEAIQTWRFGNPELRASWLCRAALIHHATGNEMEFKRLTGLLMANVDFAPNHPQLRGCLPALTSGPASSEERAQCEQDFVAVLHSYK
jgi:hypothetical protein